MLFLVIGGDHALGMVSTESLYRRIVLLYTVHMKDYLKTSPRRGEVQEAINTLQRWERMAMSRGKMPAVHETRRIREILEYFEKHYPFSSM
jgi:hypothetical protein